MVTNRLYWYIESNNLLSRNQTGFRKGMGTLDHIARLQDIINRNIRNKGHVLSVFLDFEKAFDLIWKEGLLYKLRKKGITDNTLNWINNFLSNRTIQVMVGNTLSSIRQIENGTAQGSIISPLLFLIMIDDITDKLGNVDTALFADDSTIFKAGKNVSYISKEIQKALKEVETWCDKWGFKISTAKTTVVLFSRSRKGHSQHVKLKLLGKDLELATHAKFLGILFDTTLSLSLIHI